MLQVHKKYQIFISSSMKDLREERKAIISDMLSAGHIPYGMEAFSPGNERELEVIKRGIKQSDIYIVLVGFRYGSVVEEGGPSFTQLEYRIARDLGKPILAFLLKTSEFEDRRNALKADHPDMKHQNQIIDFREEVKAIDKEKKKHRIVGYFSQEVGGLGDLKITVRDGIQKLISNKKFKAKGWIRGDEYESTRLPEEIDNNIFIRDVVKRLCEFKTLSSSTLRL